MKEGDTSSLSQKDAQQELEALLQLMGYEAKVETLDEEEGEVLLHIESEDAARLIGRGAQVLDAIQYVVNRILFKRDREAFHCIVDIERYRERRKDKLIKEAHDAAEAVRSTGRPIKLAPMRAADRRTIHQALKNEPGVETYSEKTNEEGRKRVVICGPEDSAPEESSEDNDNRGNV